VPQGRAAITYSGLKGDFKVQGTAIGDVGLGLLLAGEQFWQAMGQHSRWGSLSLLLEDWHELIPSIAGSSVIPRVGDRLAAPNPETLAALERLHEGAVHLAKTAPELITNPNVAWGLEQSLSQAIADCLRPPAEREHGGTWLKHGIVMQRFRDAIERRTDEAVYVPELCAMIGVSERTLRECTQGFLGVSRKKYLLLRRMHLARNELRNANHEASSVTEIATRFGFWELGRFSVAYPGVVR
jgi:AraC-like DNA-binding protein